MVLALLRDKTRCSHERVERSVNLPLRLQTMDGYRALLARFYGYYAPIEEQLAQVFPTGWQRLDFVQRIKSPLLSRDLQSLGLDSAMLQTLPACHTLPNVTHVDQALGCMYVLEGATLGGQIIRRLVQQRLGLDVEAGCAFFSSYGDQVGEMWTRFCGVLTEHAQGRPEREESIVAAASETFDTLDRWIGATPGC